MIKERMAMLVMLEMLASTGWKKGTSMSAAHGQSQL
jgi:hypothetical protein